MHGLRAIGPQTLILSKGPHMTASGSVFSDGGSEREHLARAHHEIRTALTVVSSNVELVRIELRETQLGPAAPPLHAHLEELEKAVARLLALAHEMRQWHDDIPRADRHPPAVKGKTRLLP